MADDSQLKFSQGISLQDQARSEASKYGTDFVKMVETILEDKSVGKAIEDEKIAKLFAVTAKSMKLSFLNEIDAKILMIRFEESILDMILYLGRGNFSLMDSMMVNQFRMIFLANVKRSVGVQGEIMNERVLQASSITHSVGVFREMSKSPGITGRIGAMFGRGGGGK